MAAILAAEPVQNSVRSAPHDTDVKMNGVMKSDKVITIGAETVQQQTPARSLPSDNPSRMNDLPDEIQHITENFLSLSQLLSRLAQRSHNELQDKIMELAKKPLPAPPILNGNSDHNSVDDASVENVEKKVLLLKFAQEQHTKWVKALVITDWSKKAGILSKLIDLKVHMQKQMEKFDFALDGMMHTSRNLAFARLPSPDLKTALEVLSNGGGPWMPDFNYIDPPELTDEEQLKWLEDINTMLSLRLSLDEHDKIPYHFRNYRISSGRVTFIVKGEFEVDLTIADEDPESQFWFIDFRFLFTPAPAELSDVLRMYLENKVNEVLATEGLLGCYRYLHELVLTHKINEMRRQTLELARGKWIDTLKIERLNRSLSVQYWTPRYSTNAPSAPNMSKTNSPKSWIIMGVHSGAVAGKQSTPKSTSFVSMRWFRDNQEVKDVKIPVDLEDISMQRILNSVIGRHAEHILASTYDKLVEKPSFTKRQESLDLKISRTEPMESSLTMQVTQSDSVVVRINPFTGVFALEPRLRPVLAAEKNLNTPGREAAPALGWLRNAYAMEELARRGKSSGWNIFSKFPVKTEDLRHILNNQDQTDATAWFKRQGWPPQFWVMVKMSLSGDQWWFIDLSNHIHGTRIKNYVPLPLSLGDSTKDNSNFFTDLTIYVSAIMSKMADLKELHVKKIRHIERIFRDYRLSPRIQLPGIHISLSDLLPSAQPDGSSGATSRAGCWAADSVRLTLTKVQPASSDEANSGGDMTVMNSRVFVVGQASLRVLDKSKFKLLQSKVDRDVSFNHRTGEFHLRIKAELGETMITALTARLQAIERLVEFLASINSRQELGVKCETITLRMVKFTYGDTPTEAAAGPAVPLQLPRRWRVVLDLANSKNIKVRLESGDPHERVLDMLRILVNQKGGLQELPRILPVTLGCFNAIGGIANSWDQLQTSRKGTLEIFPRKPTELTVRYELPSPPRRLSLEVRLQLRRGELSWHVCRSDPEPARSSDDFAKALKPVWDAKEANCSWKSLASGAATKLFTSGIEDLLRRIDQTVREVMESPSTVQQSQQQQTQQIQRRASQAGPGQQHQQMMHVPGGGGAPPNRSQHHLQRPGLPVNNGGQMRQNRAPQPPMNSSNMVDLT